MSVTRTDDGFNNHLLQNTSTQQQKDDQLHSTEHKVKGRACSF